MKTQVEIVTGFLGAGKTTYINRYLENRKNPKERVAVLQLESGEKELNLFPGGGDSIQIVRPNIEGKLQVKTIQEILQRYLPHRLILECNGMSSLEETLSLLDSPLLAKSCRVNRVVHVVDAATFELYMDNMGSILVEQIAGSDQIVVNNGGSLSRVQWRNMHKTLLAINRGCAITDSGEKDIPASWMGGLPAAVAGFMPKSSDKVLAGLFLVILAYLMFIFSQALNLSLPSWDADKIRIFSTVFLSILVQAFPFILIGALISSLLQVLVSEETVAKVFPRNRAAALVISILTGFIFPVCDCAIVPVTSRLIKKGVPVSAAITFMLSAPIVNPVVIASTLYAFPGQPEITWFRLGAGIVVAVAVGLLLPIFHKKNPIASQRGIVNYCSCGHCGESLGKAKGVFAKLHAVLKHTGAEFFDVGRYLVIGAFISSLMQVGMPKDWLSGFSGGNALSLVMMMTAAFLLSVCSTSDAFIARGFLNQFPIGAVMGFLILGPMIDIKNTLMLFGSFSRQFVIRFLLLLTGISFALLYFLTSLLL